MEIDEQTGLPKVPEGHFWRVKFSSDSWYPELIVQLRRKRSIGSKYVFGGAKNVQGYAKSVTPEMVLEGATEVYENWQKHLSAVPLFGDYPPLKLPKK